VFGIGMIAMEAMLFHSTRQYYLKKSSNDFSLIFDERQLLADLK